MKLDISGKGLTTLVGVKFPAAVEILYCDHNQLRSLEGCPKTVKELYCYNNLLTSLEGCPASVKVLCCQNNLLTSLKGCPHRVKKLYCNYNRLTSLYGCPSDVQYLECNNNQLESLYGCPSGVQSLYFSNNPLDEQYQGKTLQEIHVLNKVKAYKKGIDRLAFVIAVRIQRWWRKKWYDELDSEGVTRFCKMCIKEMIHAHKCA